MDKINELIDAACANHLKAAKYWKAKIHSVKNEKANAICEKLFNWHLSKICYFSLQKYL